MKQKIAIITTHPIQYYAPQFKLLAKQIEIRVFYTWGEASIEKFDPGFGKKVEWDIPLLEGYDYQFLKNISKNPGSHRYYGVVNPTIIPTIENYAPSAIMVIGWCYNSHLKVLRHFKGKVPIYFRGDSTLLDNVLDGIGNKLKAFVRKAVLSWVYSHVDKVFYVGSASKDYFSWAGMKEKQLVFAPHSIDNTRFEEDKTVEATAIRFSLNIPESATVILYAGKLESKKNPLLLLSSFKNVALENVYLIMLGNGELENELKESADKGKDNNNIKFVDFQNQSLMSTWYAVSDIFCLPSKGPGETWGLAINEAMVCENAIIASDKVGCARDLIKPSENGWIFESGNQSELEGILKNLPDKRMLNKMGQKSKVIIKDWSIDKTVERMIYEFNCD